jgi:hypothetical protein
MQTEKLIFKYRDSESIKNLQGSWVSGTFAPGAQDFWAARARQLGLKRLSKIFVLRSVLIYDAQLCSNSETLLLLYYSLHILTTRIYTYAFLIACNIASLICSPCSSSSSSSFYVARTQAIAAHILTIALRQCWTISICQTLPYYSILCILLLNPSPFMTSLTQSSHVFLPLPLLLTPSTSSLLQADNQSLLSFRSTCPNHPSQWSNHLHTLNT